MSKALLSILVVLLVCATSFDGDAARGPNHYSSGDDGEQSVLFFITGADGGDLQFGESFHLWNKVSQKYVIYGVRDYGINLEWNEKLSQHGFFAVRYRRSDRERQGPIRYGEKVAIGFRTSRFTQYLRYEKREYGINMDWDTEPSYEWEIRGGREGTTVRRNREYDGRVTTPVVSLYNTRNYSYVIYGEREYGINLRWEEANIPK